MRERIEIGRLQTLVTGIAWSLILPLFLGGCATTTMNAANFPMVTPKEITEVPQPEDQSKKLENLSPGQLVANGQAHLEVGNIPLAKLHFLTAMKKAPDSYPAYIALASTLEMEGSRNKAGEVYSLVLQKQPENLEALVGIGRLFREQGNTEKALEQFKAANNVDSTNVEVLTEMAITYDLLGKEPLAEVLYLTVVGLRPQLASAYNNLGFNYLLQKRYDKAISNLRLAMVKDPGNKRIINNLATAYALHGDQNKALELFEQAQDKPAAYNNLGYLYLAKGQKEKAKEALQLALESNPAFYVRAKENLKRIEANP